MTRNSKRMIHCQHTVSLVFHGISSAPTFAIPPAAKICDALKMSAIHLLAQASNDGTGFFVFGGVFMIVFILIAIVGSIFWLWMLIDCLTSNMATNEKLLWFLVIFLLHFVGALIYFAIRRSGRGPVSG